MSSIICQPGRLGGLIVTTCLLTAPAWGQFGPTRVVIRPVELRSLPRTLTLVGTVEPETRSVIGAEVAGLVTAMPGRAGDLIAAGDLICKLNDDNLRLDRDREQAKLDALNARLAELRNGTRAEELDRLAAELAAAQAVAERWQFELNRVQRLQGGEYANEKEYQDALAEQLAAEARRRAAQARYNLGVAGPRKEMIAAAEAAVAEQQAVVNQIKVDLGKTEIRAPFAGHIVRRDVEIGTWVDRGGSVVELSASETVLVRVDVPEKAIAYASVGSAANIRIEALNDSVSGIIRHVIPQADRDARTFPVEIAVANPQFRLRAGMFCRATVLAGPVEPTKAVPKDALIESRGQFFVATIIDTKDGKMAMPRPVLVGAESGNWFAITSDDVAVGDAVAVYGNERLYFPQPVVVVASPHEANPSTDGAPPTVIPPSDPQAAADGQGV